MNLQCALSVARYAVISTALWLPVLANAKSPPARDLPETVVHNPYNCPVGTVAVWTGNNFSGCTSVGGFEFGGTGSPGPGGPSVGGGGGASVANNSKPTTDKEKDKNPCSSQAEGHSIDLAHQVETHAVTLFKLPGEGGLSYSLYYVSPRGWFDNLGYWLDTNCGYVFTGGGPSDPPPCTQITFHRPDGSSIVFNGTPGTVGNYPEQGGGGRATLVLGASGIYTLHDEDASVLTFSGANLTSIKNASGIGWTITSAHAGLNARTTTVTHTSGKSFTVAVQDTIANGVVTGQVTVTDPAGHTYHYTKTFAVTNLLTQFDPKPFQLNTLTLPGSPATTVSYKYVSALHIPSDPILMNEVDYNNTPYFYISYDYNARPVSASESLNNKNYSITYTAGPGGTLTAAVTNPLGHTTTKGFSWIAGQYMLTSVSDPAVQTCGATIQSYLYDSNGHRTKSVDNNGVAHSYSYAVNGQLQTETEAAGTAIARTTSYVWDPAQQLNRLLSVTTAGQSKTEWSYTTHNRLASVKQTNLTATGTANQSLTTSYAYTLYANGMVKTLKVTAPSPGGTAKTVYAFDAQGNLTSATDGLGYVTSLSNYNALGSVGTIIGPNGDRTDFTYDARGRVASKTTHPNGGSATWTYAYDGFGLLSTLTAPDGQVTTWTRDAAMRLTKVTHNDKDGTSTETYAYNADNAVTSVVTARGSDIGKAAYYTYDDLGRLYQAKGDHGQKLTYAYDGNGNVLKVTDALGHKTSYVQDALNRVTRVTDAANGITQYGYDAGNHVTQVTGPRGLATTYAWDGLGQLWRQQSPDTGITTYAHDAYGRPSSAVRADGATLSYTYDAVNRPTKVTVGGQSRTYAWDTCTNGKGRLCQAATSASSIDYSYTSEGWIAARGISHTSGPTHLSGFTYNALGQLTSIAYPDGNAAYYDYTRGAVSGVRLKVSGNTVNGVTNVTYRPMDSTMSKWTSPNGLVNTMGYDSDLRLTGISVPGVQSLAFTWDAADRITAITNGVNGNYTQSLGYDAVDRLTSMTSGARNESYQYDAVGNRIGQVIDGVATSFAYSSGSNRLTSASGGISAAYGYNAYGSTTTINGVTAYTYDPFGRLSNAGGATFDISAEDQRLRKAFGGDVTYFVPGAGGGLLAENTNGTWKDYVWLNGRLVAMVTGGTVYSVHADQTGRAMALTAPNQSVTWASRNDPFDRNTVTGSAAFFRLGFPGQYWDAEDSLWHNGFRDYDYKTGRYIQSDPIGLGGGVNTYAYVGNNPLSYVDSLGLVKECKPVFRFPLPFTGLDLEAQQCSENGKAPSAQDAKDAKRMSDQQLDKACKANGYKDAHELKRDLGLGSDRDIFSDKNGNMYSGPRQGSGAMDWLKMNTGGPN